MVTRVVRMPTSWLITTMLRLHIATFPMDRRPIPRIPIRGRYLYPVWKRGMNSTIAWKATPKVHIPAVRKILF